MSKQKPIQLAAWQAACHDVLNDMLATTGNRHALVVASTGSGKTLAVACWFARMNPNAQVLILAPGESVARGWAESFNRVGIKATDRVSTDKKRFSPFARRTVVAITYAMLASRFKQIGSWVTKDTFVICDEIHHLGSGLSWGAAAREALSHSKFVVGLSATPFRHDGTDIPFVNYHWDTDVEGLVARADFTYTYRQSLRDGLCRSVRFHVRDAELLVEGKACLMSNSRVSRKLRFQAYRRGALRRDIELAHKTLMEERARWPTAAAMVVASTQAEAKEIGQTVLDVTGHRPPVVVSDDPTSKQTIQRFREGSEPWLVSVRQVSEGVDIPRLQVLVWATRLSTTLAVIQIVGRVLRNTTRGTGHRADQLAHVFFPRDSKLEHAMQQVGQDDISVPLEPDDDDDEVEPDEDREGPEWVVKSDFSADSQESVAAGAWEIRADTADIQYTFGADSTLGGSEAPVVVVPVASQEERDGDEADDLAYEALHQKIRDLLDPGKRRSVAAMAFRRMVDQGYSSKDAARQVHRVIGLPRGDRSKLEITELRLGLARLKRWLEQH